MQKVQVSSEYSNPGQEVLKDSILRNTQADRPSLEFRPYHARRVPFSAITSHFLGYTTTNGVSSSTSPPLFTGISTIKFSDIYDYSMIRVFVVECNPLNGKYIADMITVPESLELVFETTPELFFCVLLPADIYGSIGKIKPIGDTYGSN